MSEESEILDKIEMEHQAGGHRTGPQAGCSFCMAQLEDAQRVNEAIGSTVDPETAVADLAQRRVQRAAAAHSDEYLRKNAGTDRARRLANEEDEGTILEPTLGTVALEDAQEALDLIGVGNYAAANARAAIGIVRALAGVEEQLVRLVDELTGTEVASELESGRLDQIIKDATAMLPSPTPELTETELAQLDEEPADFSGPEDPPAA